MQRADSFEKTLILEKLRAGGEGDDRGWDGWVASPTQWTWVWVNSESWWWTGRPGVLWFMRSQRVWHNLVTELNWVFISFTKYAEVELLYHMVHHWLDGHESQWALGVGDGQEGLVCCDSWGRKEWHDWVTDLIRSNLLSLVVWGASILFSIVSCANLCSYQHCTRVPLLHLHLFIFIFLITVILRSVR